MQNFHKRMIPLTVAVRDFNLETIFGEDFEALVSDRMDEDAEVMVIDGDFATHGDLNLDLAEPKVFGAPYSGQDHPLIIVNGRLEARNIFLWRIKGLVVTGDLTCRKIHLREFYPLYVGGDLTAREAMLASAEQEGPGDEGAGAMYVRVQGKAQSPQVQTWFMPLHHLVWGEGSGTELAEDQLLDRDHWLVNPVWQM